MLSVDLAPEQLIYSLMSVCNSGRTPATSSLPHLTCVSLFLLLILLEQKAWTRPDLPSVPPEALSLPLLTPSPDTASHMPSLLYPHSLEFWPDL